MINPNLQIQQEPNSALFPSTIISAATIFPVTAISFISGTVAIATIVPPVNAPHQLTFIFTNALPAAFLTSGNIQLGITPTQYSAIILTYDSLTAKYYPSSGGGGGGGAPTNATYITQTPDAGLSAEQALSLLATGLMQVTTATGVVSSVTTSAGLAALISDETGTGGLVFATGPTLVAPVTITGVVGSSALTINGATQTASFPIQNDSQTWNNVAVTFVGKTFNVTDTASAAASILEEWKVGDVSRISLLKAGRIVTSSTFQTGGISGSDAPTGGVGICFRSGAIEFYDSTGARAAGLFSGGMTIQSGDYYSWASGTDAAGTIDVILFRDAAATLALRNTTNAQIFRVYRTFTDLSNYVRLALQTGADYLEFAAETAGTGADDLDVRLTPAGTGNVNFPGGVLLKTRAALTDGAAAAAGTLLNAPTAGDPTKWIPINDNGTTRYIPAW
jgi:hypothetical protein